MEGVRGYITAPALFSPNEAMWLPTSVAIPDPPCVPRPAGACQNEKPSRPSDPWPPTLGEHDVWEWSRLVLHLFLSTLLFQLPTGQQG